MTSFLDKLKAKMSGKNGPGASLYSQRRPEQVRKSSQTIVTNKWDDEVYREARKTDPIDNMVRDIMRGDVAQGGSREGFEMSPELVKDLFMATFKADPVLEHKRNVTKAAYPVRKIMEEILESPQLRELQEFTAGDAVMSTIATTSMQQSVVDILTRIPPPPQPGGGQGQGQGQGQGGQGGGGGGQGGGDESSDSNTEGGGNQKGAGNSDPGANSGESDTSQGSDDEGAGGINDDLDQDFDLDDVDPDPEEAAWEAAFDQAMDGMGMDFDVAAAIDKAKEEVEELDGLRKGVGIDDGTWAQMSPEERLKVAAKLKTPQMRELADVIGRMRRFALGTRATRIVNVPHEPYDVQQGDHIPRLLKSQFALLGTPETEMEFYRQLSEMELLEFKMRGHEDAGKGPIVTAIDKSGSMSGSPFNWAMGVAEALRRFAADDERDYYAMFFGSNNDRNRFEFPKGKGPWEKIQAFLSVAANGGTQFDGVLTEALKRAIDAFDGEGKGKADVCFITDGQAHLSDEWIKKFNEERERAGIRVFSVFIGGGYDMYGGGPIELLERISDVVISIKDLKPESAKAIFERI